MVAQSPIAKLVRVHLVAEDEVTLRVAPEIPWLEKYAVLGRGDDVDVRLCDRWTSRHHCAIVPDVGHVFVRDLGSKHGTFVNGKQIEQCELTTGDRLNIGLTSFIVECESQTA